MYQVQYLMTNGHWEVYCGLNYTWYSHAKVSAVNVNKISEVTVRIIDDTGEVHLMLEWPNQRKVNWREEGF